MLTKILSTVGLIIFFTYAPVSASIADIWFNEFHYDEEGRDETEFIEVVVGAENSVPLDAITVSLYNGSRGDIYKQCTLDTFTRGETVADYTFYYYTHTGSSWLQNGAPDGMALDSSGTLIDGQFLSYEGSFSGTEGPAMGVTSNDIGVLEAPSALSGSSLALEGSGSGYVDFWWASHNDPLNDYGATPGLVNYGQSFTSTSPEPVVTPEPATLILFPLGLLLLLRRK